jgi:prephenate dehydrogenase
MPDPDFLSTANIAILGLGLMGGSLAMALRGQCAALLGVDPNENVLDLALHSGLVDKASSDSAELLPQSDIVILAAPVRVILSLLGKLPGLHPGSALVLDLGSTKREIFKAMLELPPRFSPIGGHPICGKEKSGLENAQASLYQGAPFVLIPMPDTSPAGAATAERLVQAVGARPLWLDAETHDRWIAFTSHLPYLLALALAQATPSEASLLVGPGFRSTSRVAATPASVMLDILATNRLNVLESVAVLRKRLDALEVCLRDEDWEGLKHNMLAGAAMRNELTDQTFTEKHL